MTSRISLSMTVMMNNVEDTLFDMATNERGTARASEYLDAVRVLRMKKYEIQVRFKNRFVSLFQFRVRNLVRNRKSDMTLSKIGHTSFLKSLDSVEGKMIKVTVDKVRNDCQTALLNLDRRICSLLEDIDVEECENPMQPETVIEAFWESCRDIDIKPGIRQVLVDLFEKYVALDLKYLYEDLNTHLSKQILRQDRI